MEKPRRLTRREFLESTGMAVAAGLHAGAIEAPPVQEADSSAGPAGTDTDQLREVFLHPPDTAKPMTRWWWFGGAVTPEEITRELTMMRDAGLRGVELQPVYPVEVDNPERGIRNIRYFSQEWFDLLRHTAGEARRLDLQSDFTLGSGWPYGGPFIPIELAARRLQVFVRDAVGPGEFSWDLSPELVGDDKIVAAVATPVLSSQQPDLNRSQVITDQIKEIFANNQRIGLGLNRWPVRAGQWRIMVFIDSPTGMQVKRPTLGMEGYVLDHFSREALHLFLRAVGDRSLEELKSLGFPAMNSVFCDSLEVYGADWTSKFMGEFRRRRNYDLAPYLPALWEDSGPLTPHIRYDYHRTLSDLILDNFFRPLAEWCNQHGVRARVQAHGALGDVIEGYALAHIPEGENIFLGDRYQVNLRHRRLASSAAHLYQKPVVSAETYTWLRVPLFFVTLEMMKVATDSTFLDGIQQIVNHGYPYSPPQAGEPGWVFYASTLINHNNLWWRHYPHLTRYIQRTAAMLQQGISVNPVAVYLPLADVFAKFGCGALNIDVELDNHLGKELFDELRRAGYDFDLINDRALDQAAKVEEGKLWVGTGAYSVVIVPGVRFMPPESMERLAEFAEGGGLVIFIERLPEAAPGLGKQAERTARLRAGLARFWAEHEPQRGKRVGTKGGGVAYASDRSTLLRILPTALSPDCRIIPAGDASDAAMKSARENVGFLHRRLGSADFYFLSNISNQPQRLQVQFAAGHRRPERWNTETGTIDETLPYVYGVVHDETEDVTVLQMRLDPFESCFIVFRDSQEKPAVTRTNFWGPLRIEKSGKQNILGGRAEEDGEYWFETTFDGGRHRLAVRGIPEPLRLEGPWTLKFGEGLPVALDALRSWNDLLEGKTYSGWGTYEIAFEFAEKGQDLDWILDLGQVHETAEAELNGVALGAAWKGARRLECGRALKVGTNQLTVRVANLWIHYVRSLPPPDVRALAETYGIRWGRYGETSPPELPPSGLLGPVRLVAQKPWVLRLSS